MGLDLHHAQGFGGGRSDRRVHDRGPAPGPAPDPRRPRQQVHEQGRLSPGARPRCLRRLEALRAARGPPPPGLPPRRRPVPLRAPRAVLPGHRPRRPGAAEDGAGRGLGEAARHPPQQPDSSGPDPFGRRGGVLRALEHPHLPLPRVQADAGVRDVGGRDAARGDPGPRRHHHVPLSPFPLHGVHRGRPGAHKEPRGEVALRGQLLLRDQGHWRHTDMVRDHGG
mmetsp:Transcript_36680/g.103492  ORF Transcript_36680/g.103492 Transcript_36680/m.103492 type:complete len:224 (+) Transcript_36680:258-929(+)